MIKWNQNAAKKILQVLSTAKKPMTTEALSKEIGFGIAATRYATGALAFFCMVKKGLNANKRVVWELTDRVPKSEEQNAR